MSNSFQLLNTPIAGGPAIEFVFAGDVCTAELAGAKLRVERLDDLVIHDATGKVLASVVVSKLWDDESVRHDGSLRVGNGGGDRMPERV